jgi:hypothetical protein
MLRLAMLLELLGLTKPCDLALGRAAPFADQVSNRDGRGETGRQRDHESEHTSPAAHHVRDDSAGFDVSLRHGGRSAT